MSTAPNQAVPALVRLRYVTIRCGAIAICIASSQLAYSASTAQSEPQAVSAAASSSADGTAQAKNTATIKGKKGANPAALNPQPLPPGSSPVSRSQIKSPSQNKGGAVSLNPQPLPPKELPGTLLPQVNQSGK
jgi:hypothetical protein